jgi:hypothetical protein
VRGHEHLMAIRMKTGRKPKYVIVTCGTDQERGWRWWPIGGAPEVEIQPTDQLSVLDLRWAHGLTLAIIGDTEERVRAFVDAASRYKPAKMYALMHDQNLVMESGSHVDG